jgi:hypothetical protein
MSAAVGAAAGEGERGDVGGGRLADPDQELTWASNLLTPAPASIPVVW